ncbi:MAG: hypothetical protein WDM79_07395 [Terricaulis sp.]
MRRAYFAPRFAITPMDDWRNDRIACLPNTPVWRDSVDAARRYRDRPSTQSIYRVLEETSARPELWNAHNRGGVREDGSAPSAFHQFEAAMAARDLNEAAALVLGYIAQLARPEERLAARIAFAARAILVHRALDVADRIVAHARTEHERPGDAALDQFLLRMRCRAESEQNIALLERIIASDHPGAPGAACDWMTFRWRYENAGRDTLNDNLALARRLKSNARLLQECLAEAFVLDPGTALAMLEERPDLARGYKTLLPLAVHLREHGAGNADAADVAIHADLFDALVAAGRALTDFVTREPSMAIVGNSPCERGRGAGSRIDAHGAVTRFNYFAINDENKRDYGEKLTIHARSPRKHPTLDASSARAAFTVFCQGDMTHAVRNWSHALTLRAQGVRLACLPLGSNTALWRALHAEPSLGLAFLNYVKTVRGALPRESCFGFSFTDQIGPDASPAHYFDDKTPALTHQWAQERLIFDAMVT